MPIDEFLTTAEGMRKSGHRPVRFRPYADGQVVRVAAVWTQDGRSWRMSSGQTAQEVRQEDERNKRDRFLPVDAAGYISIEKDGKPADRFAALWVEKTGNNDAQLYVGTTADEETEVEDILKKANLIARTIQAVIGVDGRTRYCGVWGRPSSDSVSGQAYRDQLEGTFEQSFIDLRDQLLIDVAVNGASKPQTTRDRVQAALESADKKLKSKPETSTHGWLGPWRISVWERIRRHSMTFRS